MCRSSLHIGFGRVNRRKIVMNSHHISSIPNHQAMLKFCNLEIITKQNCSMII